MENTKSVRMILPFFMANGLLYGMNSLYYSFIPKYLKDFGGKGDGEIGIILSIGPLVGIISLIFFGVMSDKAKYKNNVLMLIISISAVLFYMIRINNSLGYFIFIFAAFMFVLSPFGGLLDAISLEYTTAAQIKYGPIRCTGSLIFGVISLLLTLILTFFGDSVDVTIIFPVFVCMAILSVISVKMMPAVKGHAHGKKKLPVMDFFKDKTCITLMAILFAGQFSFGCFYNFMQNFMENNLNLAPWVWGLSVFFMIIGEVIFFFKYDYFFKRFSIKTIVLFAVVTQVLRYVSLAFLHDKISILITNLLTGAFCGVMHYAASYYINLTVKKEMKALGQTLLFAISFYVPRFLSGIIGGITVERFGFSVLLAICAIINLIVLIISSFICFKNPA